jgi:hypothetical protein
MVIALNPAAAGQDVLVERAGVLILPNADRVEPPCGLPSAF